jgi:hypothetical protein
LGLLAEHRLDAGDEALGGRNSSDRGLTSARISSSQRSSTRRSSAIRLASTSVPTGQGYAT